MPTHNRWLVLLIVSTALFLITIDVTVLYTALPRLTHDLGATNAQKLWIVNAYPLVMAGLLMSTGTLGDRIGHRRMFLAGLAVFGIASLAAAYAPNPQLLIAARALLAVGAAAMMPATLSIIRIVFTDDRERNLAIGVWAAVASGGAAFGPVVGGVLLEYFWWGSVFLINVPVVLLALALTPKLVPAIPGNPDRTWQISGGLVVMVGLVGTIYAIKEFGKLEPSMLTAIIAGVVGLGFLVWFVRMQRAMAAPMVDFALFRHPVFRAGAIGAAISMFVMIGVLLVFTQRVQLVSGMTPLQAAFAIMPLSLASLFAGPLTGLVAQRLGHARVVWLALLVAALGLLGLIFTYDGSMLARFVPLVAIGFGLGATMTGASGAIMLNAPEQQAGMAASIEEVSYEIGSTAGVAMLGSLMTWMYARSFILPDGVETPALARDGIDQAILAAESMAPDLASRVLSAAQFAFDQGFVATLWLSVIAITIAAVAIAVSARNAGTAGHRSH
ncbi:MFS transporter [Luteimonas fraxinea]|uniref:MFS transporter n=1 Tax=Luteimonas fraxinea TaxID=2901869 RepID=A0ABS8UCS3_9GAMM|nr:MFS transporter [Luteimonas fraxinea]MCD9097298.1 MFS transporter [Luteimonas fraxinea]MCD9125137.1 MFS transporter [Luteimonas fraxinea]UHH11560.1 MFS transporter [Luteimonas fraxinea]